MTSTETRTSWSDRFSPRNWSLVWKLVAVGLVPALLAVVLGVLRVADQAHAASELEAANRLLDVRVHVGDTADALRVERDRATAFVAERRLGDRGPLQDATAQTDATSGRARTALENVNNLDATTRSALEEAQGGLAQLSALRGEVVGSAPLQPRDVVDRYTVIIARTDTLARALLLQMRTRDVASLADALTAAAAGAEALAQQHTVLGAALRVGKLTPQDRALVNGTDNALAGAYSSYKLALPPTIQPVNFFTGRDNDQLDAEKASILQAPDPGPFSVTVAQWDDAVAAVNKQIETARTDVRSALVSAGGTAASRSSNLAGINSVLLMLGLLLAATIIVMVARSLTRSLRVLRSSALDVAQRRLPQAVESMRAGGAPDVTVEPVPLQNRDEVGQVARAFDAVHGQALRLAADQAALQSNVSSMFVNLSRRSQGLVERQLQLIEQLESNEQDPDQLSNLFQLDHLATRMRRNSENLLVLAGTDFAKRNVAPVPLVDVLRAAVSEIEHYQRITVQAPPQATVVGRATSDVVHLLAELLDNATNFSPPDSQVVMSSTRTSDGSILVEIADRGVGMSDNELADANRRLTTPSAVDVSASRRMGLFVVGRLGVRHGITVNLGGAPMGGPGGGVTASVVLPAHLVMSSGEGGGRPLRGDTPLAPAAPTNGVPPQRAGNAGRPPQRAALAATSNGQSAVHPAALNGLPTRTPGSSLRRDPAPLSAESAESATSGSPFTVDRADEQQGPLMPRRPAPAGPAAPAAAEPDVDGRGPDGAAAVPDGDSLPTGAVPALGGRPAGSTRSDKRRTDDGDDRADTPPAGQDRRLPRGATAFRRGSLPGGGTAPTPDAGAVDGAPTRAPAPSGASIPGRKPGPGSRTPETAATGADTGAGAAGVEDTGRPGAGADRAVDAAQPGRDGAAAKPGSTAGRPAASASAAAAAAGSGRDDAGQRDAAPAQAAQGNAAQGNAAQGNAAQEAAAQGDARQGDAEQADSGAAPAGDDAAGDAAPQRPSSPRPRPTPAMGPNGTFHDLSVPSTAYPTPDDGVAQNGAGNGTGQYGGDQYGGRYGDRNGAFSPPTTPLPLVPSADGPAQSDPFSVPLGAGADDAADALFSASVPSISEPEGLPRSRRPLSELRQGGPVDVTETTPIFEEIASAWFADERPVPVDWELGRRPGAEAEPEPVDPAPTALDADRPTTAAEWIPPGAAPSGAPAAGPSPQAFATAADEGWRAASGAAAERPDELTSAGLPKRRPRARLVPGSAGSAVLAAPAAPTRSAESIRGRLASYQQGVRQGREIRLRRDPGGAGTQPAPTEENGVAPTGGEHDEDNR